MRSSHLQRVVGVGIFSSCEPRDKPRATKEHEDGAAQPVWSALRAEGYLRAAQ